VLSRLTCNFFHSHAHHLLACQTLGYIRNTQITKMTQTISFEPKFITFDCYGTLTNFSHLNSLARSIYCDRLSESDLDRWIELNRIYRFDEIMGPYKPYDEVLVNAAQRTCKRMNITFDREEAEQFYKALPTWGPWPDVTDGLRRLASKYKLVIVSNSNDEVIMSNVDKLGAPFHAVYTAQQAQCYKPRLGLFEYVYDKLGCQPEEVMHVSASMEYDHHCVNSLGVQHQVFVNRSKAKVTAPFKFYEVDGIGALASAMGL